MTDAGMDEGRILVLAPRGRDAFAIERVLTRSGIATVNAGDLPGLVAGLDGGAGAAILTEEAISGGDVEALFAWLERQPPWSDMPTILLSTKRVGNRPEHAAIAVERLGNVILLERPIHAETLAGAARSALRARRRQYQARAHLAERDEAQRRLRLVNETLETRVEERTRELMVAEEAMRHSQKLEAVGQLTGGVAHDFNNLLTIIRSSVDLLRRPDLRAERRDRYMDAVSDTVDRAAKLTGQLLAFARRQALQPEVFEVGARLRKIVDMLDTVTGGRIRVVTEFHDTPCFVRADVSQFETALVNMAVNARDAMDGEGVLTLSLRGGLAMPPIRGHAGGAGPFAAVALSDTGPGIPAAHLARLFEPFFTTKEVGKGTGLGLSQVFGFAKQSGGDVAVASGTGTGATFTIYLPQVEPELPSEEIAPESEPALDGAGRRVLVVEDNVEVGRFSTQVLADLGYETTWASNAEDAVEKLGQDGAGFDVVFSDVVMPGMGGIALAEDLRRRIPDLPVVLASGYSHVLAQEGPHGFELLQKPYSAETLSATLRRVAPRRR
jgi:signal transduction histidine kinase